MEFVSANPTGPLHVGHGRSAAYGDALSRVLRAAGYSTESEYYINDAGRQMDILALSVWLRYLELCGEPNNFPLGAYQGDYIFDIESAQRAGAVSVLLLNPKNSMFSEQADLKISQLREILDFPQAQPEKSP